MSFARGTLHYNLPITNGSDKRSWFDTNDAFITIDAAIWEAAQSAGAAVTAVEALTTQVGTLSETVQTVANAYTALSGNVNTLSEVVQGHTLNIQQLQTATANKADSVAIADAYNPNLTYSVGDVVMYDGQRYKCVTAVTTGEPFDQDKWQGEDVQTVIDEINSDLTDLQKNNVGNYVNISAYSTFEDAYVCPSDGYAFIDNHGASDIGIITVYGANAATDNEILAKIANRTGYEVMSLYVRKGCKLVVLASAGTPYLRFYPLA